MSSVPPTPATMPSRATPPVVHPVPPWPDHADIPHLRVKRRRSSHERRMAQHEKDPAGYVGRLRSQAAGHRERAARILMDPPAYAAGLRQSANDLTERADAYALAHGMTTTTTTGVDAR